MSRDRGRGRCGGGDGGFGGELTPAAGSAGGGGCLGREPGFKFLFLPAR